MLKIGDKVKIRSKFLEAHEGRIIKIVNDYCPYTVEIRTLEHGNIFPCRFQENELELITNEIRLVDLDLSRFSVEEQANKWFEELEEFVQALESKDKGNKLEECCDVIQATIGLLTKVTGYTSEDVKRYWDNFHLAKMENRPR